MNNREVRFLNAMMRWSRSVKATAATIDLSRHGLGYIKDHKEARRLMESDDYRKGWEACHERIKDALTTLVLGDERDVDRFILDNEPTGGISGKADVARRRPAAR